MGICGLPVEDRTPFIYLAHYFSRILNAGRYASGIQLREKMGVVMSFLEQSNFFSDLIRNATRGVGHLGHDVKELAK